jgi:uncharacterized protein (TIGR02453 family)
VNFAGIPLAALDFYEDLEADNSKTFWTAHKAIYDESVKAPIEALATELAEEFGTAKFFRPYRDVRFSKDKTPYKTHQGVWFGESRRYFHVSAAGLFVGGGFYDMQSDQVARLRAAIAEDVTGNQLEAALKAAARSKLEVGGEQLTRVPTGYDKDHPRAELLKRKSLTVHREMGAPEWLSSKKAKAEVVKAFRAMEPVIVWLRQNVGESEKPRERR